MKPLSYHALLEALPEPGCAICRLLLRDVERFLDSLLYERVTSPETQAAFRAGRGLCNAHGWGLVDKGNALGVATLYAAVMDDLLQVVEQASGEMGGKAGLGRLLGAGGQGAALAEALEPAGPCLACELRVGAEARYVRTFSQHLGEADFQVAYRASAGLCLAHFRAVLSQTRDPARLEALVSIQADKWARLKADLEEYRRKSDYRRSGEAMGAEGDSWRRAIRATSGEPGALGG